MKPRFVTKEKETEGFTLLELLAAVITAAVLAALLLPTLQKPKGSSRINCVSNLKQIGLAFRMWSNDHQERFPWQVSRSEDGTLEYVEQGGVLPHFQAVSNELTTPKVLACASDKSRTRATAFTPAPGGAQITLLTNARTQISYFVGLDANETRPQSILTGDRNLRGGRLSPNGILTVTRTDQVSFTRELHDGQGNIGLGDGSAQQMAPNTHTLKRQFEAALNLQTNEPAQLRLVLPQ